ncbi:uncharacterized protein cd44a [Odontesthes bonariensis]|uniref:uncharacterized protein cd44a n=1 Tax=Odontesthes bonariensis TaxID=219752 RepID=UPI003F583CA1
MKMRVLHLVFLGLLAAVHSTPVNVATKIPAEHKVDVIQEVITDGFLIFYPPTAESHEISTTTQTSVSLFDNFLTKGGAESFIDSAVEFGSGDSTTLSSSPAQSSTSTKEPTMNRIFYPPTAESHEISTTTQTSVSLFDNFLTKGGAESFIDSAVEFGSGDSPTLSSSPAQSSTSTKEPTMNRIFYPPTAESHEISTTTQTSVSLFDNFLTKGGAESFIDSAVEFGSGDSTTLSSSPAQSSTSTKGSPMNRILYPPTAESPEISTTLSVSGSELKDSEHKELEKNAANTLLTVSKTETTATKQVQDSRVGKLEESGHSTPDWIIILGFIVGLVALIMLCAAVATRDKWNGTNKAPRDETKTNSSNQMRELEMQSILHKEQPRENGKDAEYTVLSVEDLPGTFSSD